MSNLLISTCSEKLSEREFVFPIVEIVKPEDYKILHYTECTEKDISKASRIMICGTSLQDNAYLGDLNIFKNLLLGFEGPILGICSGMQIISSLFEYKIVENVEIGMIEVRTLESNELCEGKFQAYSIHNFSVDNLEFFTILARSDTSVQAIKHKSREIFGVSFHPEVRNEEIVENFLRV
ncbi:MAG: hypothetical protein MK215_02655 [Candidatus Poseidoniia archaeon]|jgi:GMP synthase (glutamine-hydrolysing)|nr:hypothetical protein [Candidatus Poseidoniia archaeon]